MAGKLITEKELKRARILTKEKFSKLKNLHSLTKGTEFDKIAFDEFCEKAVNVKKIVVENVVNEETGKFSQAVVAYDKDGKFLAALERGKVPND